MQFIDNPTRTLRGIVSLESALESGKIKATNPDELKRFERAFHFAPQKVVEYSARMQKKVKPNISPKEKADLLFTYFLPEFFTPSRVPGWKADLVFKIAKIGAYTIRIDGDACAVTKGAAASPACLIETDFDTLSGVLKYYILYEANQLERAGFRASSEGDTELDDYMLEEVVGGGWGTYLAAPVKVSLGFNFTFGLF